MARALELCAEHGGACRCAAGAAASRGGGGRGGLLARGVPRRALHARRARRHGRARRDLRDGDHVGALPGLSRARERGGRGGGARGVRTTGEGVLPLHPRLPRRARRRTSPCSRPRAAARRSSSGRRSSARSSEAIIAEGGTITHHHAVGRDHRPWYDRQRPEPFARGAARGQGGGRPRGDHEPGRADRSAADEDRGARPRRRRRPARGRARRARAARWWSIARERTAAVIDERGLRVQQRDARRVRRAPARASRGCGSRWTC